MKRCHCISISEACKMVDPETGHRFLPSDFDEPIFIPGCIGGAVYGKHACTCYTYKNPQKKESLEYECNFLKQRVAELESKLHKLTSENNELLRQGLPVMIRRRIDDPAYLLYLSDKIKSGSRTMNGASQRS